MSEVEPNLQLEIESDVTGYTSRYRPGLHKDPNPWKAASLWKSLYLAIVRL